MKSRSYKKKVNVFVAILVTVALTTVIHAQDTTGTGTENRGTLGTQGTQETQGTQNTTGGTGMQQDVENMYGTNADQWSQVLSDRLTLDASQTDSVRSILIDYQRQRAALSNQDMDDNRLNQFNSTFNSRIQSLLDDNQVNTFNSYGETWWNDINTTISNANSETDTDMNQY